MKKEYIKPEITDLVMIKGSCDVNPEGGCQLGNGADACNFGTGAPSFPDCMNGTGAVTCAWGANPTGNNCGTGSAAIG